MSGILWNFISFVVALSILVAVHEFGHFWVARRCGIKVEKFSIGFGRSLWKRTGKDGTKYSLSMIPLGGYVKMLDSRVEDISPELHSYAFDKQTLWKRVAVVSAGPIFNFIFAIFAYWAIFFMGVPTIKPVIGEVAPYSIAAEAGLTSGMEITSVSNTKTLNWESVNMKLASHIGDAKLTLTVISNDDINNEEIKTLDLTHWEFNPETESAMSALGFKPFIPKISMVLKEVSPNSAGEKAGLLAGDKLIKINGQTIEQWQQVVQLIKSNPSKTLTLLVEREGQFIDMILVPESRQVSSEEKTEGFAGIAPMVGEWPKHLQFNMQYGVVQSLYKSIEKTGLLIDLTISMLKKLIVGDIGLNNLSGPISIAKGAGATADYGLVSFLGFLALISVNLGIINLVPLPMLDGGHLLFFFIEAVIRKPVPEKVQEIGYRIGGVIIFSLMIVAILNDFNRL